MVGRQKLKIRNINSDGLCMTNNSLSFWVLFLPFVLGGGGTSVFFCCIVWFWCEIWLVVGARKLSC